MANTPAPPALLLDNLTFTLPDGRVLFDALSERFDTRPTGLVGRNGIGKTMLARLLAGELQPTHGHIVRNARIRYLPQAIDLRGRSVAQLAGFGAVLDALARLEQGLANDHDFDLTEGRWDIAQRLQRALADAGLAQLDLHAPAAQLSGGEARRVALLGAAIDDAFLILDEPTNHLDRDAREALSEKIFAHKPGVLVISHDRALLDRCERIVELKPDGLRSYGGNYDFYRETREAEQQARQTALEHAQAERKRGEREWQRQHERQQRRTASGNRHARDANQAKILQGLQKNRSEVSAGKLRREHEQQREQSVSAVREAAQYLADESAIALYGSDSELPEGKSVLHLEQLVLPFGSSIPLNLHIEGPRHVVLSGPNGCGKSTLLKVIAGLLAPRSGECRVSVTSHYLDQQLAHLDPGLTPLELLSAAAPSLRESDARERLDHIGLRADQALQPSGQLSGGERMKLALACALNGAEPAQLLLLDEPDNHLDLISLQALENGLQNFRGALLAISHDEHFIRALRPTHRLRWHDEGWLFEPCTTSAF